MKQITILPANCSHSSIMHCWNQKKETWLTSLTPKIQEKPNSLICLSSIDIFDDFHSAQSPHPMLLKWPVRFETTARMNLKTWDLQKLAICWSWAKSFWSQLFHTPHALLGWWHWGILHAPHIVKNELGVEENVKRVLFPDCVIFPFDCFSQWQLLQNDPASLAFTKSKDVVTWVVTGNWQSGYQIWKSSQCWFSAF